MSTQPLGRSHPGNAQPPSRTRIARRIAAGQTALARPMSSG
jgi:hypothetical protein